MTSSPYENLPSSSFWRTGVANQVFPNISGLYKKKFPISTDTKIATAGSCFAQHISRYLRKNGFNVINREPPPPGLSEVNAMKFGYGMYSARYGNIYTTRQLWQLALEAFGKRTVRDDCWRKDSGYVDALRPNVEPFGLSSPEEVRVHRQYHLKQVKALMLETELFIFTFGLTESWESKVDGTAYPTCPGTIAGTFDAEHYKFCNYSYNEVMNDFIGFYNFAKRQNPNLKFLITVSPVPLTATAGPHHVLQATTHSKSVLRAVAGSLADDYEDIDYFPSYEIITAPWTKGRFYAPNFRNVVEDGVDAVMRTFFAEHGDRILPPGPGAIRTEDPGDECVSEDDAVCEELLLDAFGKGRNGERTEKS
ncbi:MAG: GSCFA domain-containing protein [Verrucomicrobiota bacterium]